MSTACLRRPSTEMIIQDGGPTRAGLLSSTLQIQRRGRKSFFWPHDISLPHSSRVTAKWGDLGAKASRFDVVVCDDDSTEVGNFLALNSKDRLACIIHAKAATSFILPASPRSRGSVGRLLHRSRSTQRWHLHRTKDPDRWNTDVYANEVQLTELSRSFKNAQHLSVGEVDDGVKGALTNRSWQLEAWILATRLLDRSELEDDLPGPPTNGSWQMQMYLNTLFTACARGNTGLPIYYH
ncbi:hypothetical protein SAMN05216338_1003317 [Bradyrhizobium sp. Rc2d]|nr:hypothetical protein SAMN05216338_1003317 [Bradyrhizobium sp. Rc2d]